MTESTADLTPVSLAAITGRVILDFQDGRLVAVLPVADSDEEAALLLRQVEQAAVYLSRLNDAERDE